MRKIGGVSCALFAAALTLPVFVSNAFAVDRMDDWVGQNTNPTNESVGNGTNGGRTLYAPDNNYGIISATSVGGQIQSKVNFGGAVPSEIVGANVPYIYLSDQVLDTTDAGPDGVWAFDDELHMTGTITFNSPQNTEPNICFCWYSDDGNDDNQGTNHRIGLGISNLTVAQGGAVANKLRIDYGYASTGGNNFPFASDDGTGTVSEANALIPNGSYPFTFDYVPGTGNGTTAGDGTVSITIGTGNPDGTTGEGFWWRSVSPLPQQPWNLDLYELNRFGIVQRSTSNTTQLGFYSVTFSDVTYSGGTDAPVVEETGDHNGDGFVDAADYVTWRKDPAANGGDPGGYDAFYENFGDTVPGVGGSGGVPEPSSLILCLGGVFAVTFIGRSSRRR